MHLETVSNSAFWAPQKSSDGISKCVHGKYVCRCRHNPLFWQRTKHPFAKNTVWRPWYIWLELQEDSWLQLESAHFGLHPMSRCVQAQQVQIITKTDWHGVSCSPYKQDTPHVLCTPPGSLWTQKVNLCVLFLAYLMRKQKRHIKRKNHRKFLKTPAGVLAKTMFLPIFLK